MKIILALLLFIVPIVTYGDPVLTPDDKIASDLALLIQERSNWAWNTDKNTVMLCLDIPNVEFPLCSSVPDIYTVIPKGNGRSI